MLGGELRNNDDFTLWLITNGEVLDVNQHSHSAHPVVKLGDIIMWEALSGKNEPIIAVFNTGSDKKTVTVNLKKLGLDGNFVLRDLWQRKDAAEITGKFKTEVNSHGAKLFLLKR